MTRYLFPDDRLVYNIGPTNSTFVSAYNQVLRVFLDGAASEPAIDLLNFPDLEPITNYTLTVDSESQIPQFYGPDGVTSLFIQSVLGGEVKEITSGLQDRLTAVESGSGIVIDSQTFTFYGALAPRVGQGRWYVEEACTWVSGRAAVGTAPTIQAIILDIKKNAFDGGGSIYTSTGNRPSIAINAHTQVSITPDITTFAPGDYLTVDVAQVVDGSDLTYTIRLVRN